MNIGQIKVAAWAVAALLTLGLSWYVFDFARGLKAKSEPTAPALVKGVLEGVTPLKAPSDKLFAYEQSKRIVALLDWTGAPKAAIVTPEAPKGPETPVVTPVKKLVRITMMRYDPTDATGSRVALRYRPEAGVTNPVVAAFSLLKVNDALAAPHNGIKVAAIEADSVTFSFGTPGRENETLTCEDFDAKAVIVMVGPDGDVKLPGPHATIVKNTNEVFRPGKTTPLGRNTYKLGTDDIKTIGEEYPRILGTEVQTAQHRDPKTGKYDGIEIKSILPGSIAERHGAQQGDVVKSINGHPVNSTGEAITYVKTNSNTTSTWEVVVENKGKQRTVTYQSPSN